MKISLRNRWKYTFRRGQFQIIWFGTGFSFRDDYGLCNWLTIDICFFNIGLCVSFKPKIRQTNDTKK